MLQALAVVASLNPGALSGLVASTALLGDHLGPEANGTAAAFPAVPKLETQPAAVPQQLLRQLLALVPHMQVSLPATGDKVMHAAGNQNVACHARLALLTQQ